MKVLVIHAVTGLKLKKKIKILFMIARLLKRKLHLSFLQKNGKGEVNDISLYILPYFTPGTQR